MIPPSPTVHSGASSLLAWAVSFERSPTRARDRLRRTHDGLSDLITHFAHQVLDLQPVVWRVNLHQPRVSRAKMNYTGFHSYADLGRDLFVARPLSA